MRREDLDRMVLEAHAESEDPDVAADARRRLEEQDEADALMRQARERRGG